MNELELIKVASTYDNLKTIDIIHFIHTL